MRSVLIFSFLILLSSCSSNEKEAESLNNEGVSYLDKENFEKAELSFRKAAALKGVEDELMSAIARNMSLLFSATLQKDSALLYAKKAYTLAETDSYNYLVSKAEYAILNNEIEEARTWYEKAKEKNSNDMAVYNSLGMIYSGKYGFKFEDVDLALENNLKAYELAPRDPLAEALAFSYMNADKYAESLPLWKKLRTSQPSNMEFLFHEGVSLYFSGEEKKGKLQMDKAADRDETCREMYQQMLK